LRIATRVMSAATLALLLVGAATAPGAASDVTGHVYVNENTAGVNRIAAFDRHADGSLTATAGSPFAAGGQGTGSVVGSQGALQLSSDGRYLIAADAGSNQISVLRVLPNGSLARVQGSPVSSNGIEPVSIAVHGGLVYVANEGDKISGTGSNYTGFRLNAGGHLTPIAGSTFALPSTANPGDILFNSTGTNLIGVEVGTTDPSTFLIDSFTVGRDGRLTAAPGSPFAAEAAGPFGSEFSPVNPGRLYVSNAIGLRLQCRLGWRLVVNRRIAVSRRPNCALLGGDHARRRLPVHRQHREHLHLELPHQRGRLAELSRYYPVQEWRRNPAV
jgi:6-phosphogluconolactonase